MDFQKLSHNILSVLAGQGKMSVVSHIVLHTTDDMDTGLFTKVSNGVWVTTTPMTTQELEKLNELLDVNISRGSSERN